jgi:hypothetical protein
VDCGVADVPCRDTAVLDLAHASTEELPLCFPERLFFGSRHQLPVDFADELVQVVGEGDTPLRLDSSAEDELAATDLEDLGLALPPDSGFPRLNHAFAPRQGQKGGAGARDRTDLARVRIQLCYAAATANSAGDSERSAIEIAVSHSASSTKAARTA